MISTRRAKKLRAYVIRKLAMKRELDAYLTERAAAIAASSDRWAVMSRAVGRAIWNETTKETR